MLNLISVLPQVEAMAKQVAEESGAVALPTEEISRILKVQDAQRDVARLQAIEAFQAKYNVKLTRETFTQSKPGADGTFVLKSDGNDPLPPIGCIVKVHGYHSETWRTIVIGTDEESGTYTAIIKEE